MHDNTAEPQMPDPAQQAMSRLRERLLLDSRDIGAMLELAQHAAAAGDLAQAIELGQRALRVEPQDLQALFLLGGFWAELGDSERAAERFQRMLDLAPGDRYGAAGALAALPPAGTPTEAYVRTLFDQYAGRFDASLAHLSYQGPALAASLLRSRLGEPRGALRMLDLGCGTGLAAVALQPWAQSIDGVDLAPAMVAEAARRGVYASVAVGEAVRFLEQAGDQGWDLIAAIDVLNYLQDLGPFLRAARRRTSLLIGTVESAEDPDMVVLRPTRRWAYGERAFAAEAAAAGWSVAACRTEALRHENGQPVNALAFTLVAA